MNILAISGSLRPGSTNGMLVQAIVALAASSEPAHAVTVYDGLGELPHFSPDLEGETPDDAPAPVRRLRHLLADADAVLICTPEYAHGMPGSLKNLLDWTVSSGEFDAKPTAALSASPSASGGDRARTWLTQTLRVLGARIPDAVTFSVAFIRSRFDAVGNLSDVELETSLKAAFIALEALNEAANRE